MAGRTPQVERHKGLASLSPNGGYPYEGLGAKSAPHPSAFLFIAWRVRFFKEIMHMSGEKIDYAAIIADLEAKRAALETAITSLKTVIASGALGPSEGTSYVNLAATVVNPAAPSGEIPDGAFHGKTIPAAIKLYLSLMHKKQTAREISDGLKKGGMESTSKWFDKIIYATLDRLRKGGEIVKIEGNWGLPEWYPALMRAGIGENGQKPKRRGRPRKVISKAGGQKLLPAAKDIKEDQGHHPAKLSERIVALLNERKNEEFTAKQLSERFGIHAKVIAMTMGTLMKKGGIRLSAPGTYSASKFGERQQST